MFSNLKSRNNFSIECAQSSTANEAETQSNSEEIGQSEHEPPSHKEDNFNQSHGSLRMKQVLLIWELIWNYFQELFLCASFVVACFARSVAPLNFLLQSRVFVDSFFNHPTQVRSAQIREGGEKRIKFNLESIEESPENARNSRQRKFSFEIIFGRRGINEQPIFVLIS